MDKYVKPTSIRIDEALKNRIMEDAKRNKRSISKQIEYMLSTYYEVKQITERD